MNLLKAMEISSSGLQAQRTVIDTISMNLANVQTTRGDGGDPYRRKRVVFSNRLLHPTFAEAFSSRFRMTGDLQKTHPVHFGLMEVRLRRVPWEQEGGLQSTVIEDLKPFQSIYDPSHPDSDRDGYLLLPNINIVEEMVDMMKAVRSYEANITAFNAVKSMALKALEIGR